MKRYLKKASVKKQSKTQCENKRNLKFWSFWSNRVLKSIATPCLSRAISKGLKANTVLKGLARTLTGKYRTSKPDKKFKNYYKTKLRSLPIRLSKASKKCQSRISIEFHAFATWKRKTSKDAKRNCSSAKEILISSPTLTITTRSSTSLKWTWEINQSTFCAKSKLFANPRLRVKKT